MASSSRLSLLLALVATLLLVAAAAQNDTPANGGSRPKNSNTCKKVWRGCNKCTGRGANKVCEDCKDPFAIVEDNKCICDAENGYGTITSKQWKECQADKAEIEAAANGGKARAKARRARGPKVASIALLAQDSWQMIMANVSNKSPAWHLAGVCLAPTKTFGCESKRIVLKTHVCK